MRLPVVLAAVLAAACASPARTKDAGKSPTPQRVATREDSLRVRELCAVPDSVLAGVRACDLRPDVRSRHPYLRVF